MAVYFVTGPEGTKPRLVETRTSKGAVNHVAGSLYKATALNTSDLVKHIKSGIEVETVVEDTPDTTADLALKTEPVKSDAAVEQKPSSFSAAKAAVKEGFAPKTTAVK